MRSWACPTASAPTRARCAGCSIGLPRRPPSAGRCGGWLTPWGQVRDGRVAATTVSTVLIPALVAAIVTAFVEYLAKPYLEVWKERLQHTHRCTRENARGVQQTQP